jgi:NADH:ubiquinone oxidoreductase subunit E/NAD-dependent dihydropyrimidine dehydrogenase PreA subunit
MSASKNVGQVANLPSNDDRLATCPTENSNGSGKQPVGAVMVCGGGVAGIQASLDLSAAGFRVYLVEESPTIGGSMARLDKTFPTGDCATCIISPKLVECMRDYNIDVLTMADVESLEGDAGHFKATVRKRPRGVKIEKCTGCGDCWTVCPVRNTAETPPPFQPSEPLEPAEAIKLKDILARHEGPEKGDRHLLPERPEGCLAQKVPVPFFRAGNLMPVLQEIDQAFGFLPKRMIEHLAAFWQLRPAEILRVASFYDRFRLEPAGRHVVEVCEGTSCHSRGSRALRRRLEKELGIAPGETDKAGRFTLRTVRCLGLCALAPSMKIDGQPFGRVKVDRVSEILEQFA